MCGFDEARRFWIVVESLAELTNSDFENCVADEGFRPNRVEEFVFGDKLTRASDQIVNHREGLRPELDGIRTSPKAFVGRVQSKRIEKYPFLTPHINHQTLPKLYGKFTTWKARRGYCPLLWQRWQYKRGFRRAAFASARRQGPPPERPGALMNAPRWRL